MNAVLGKSLYRSPEKCGVRKPWEPSLYIFYKSTSASLLDCIKKVVLFGTCPLVTKTALQISTASLAHPCSSRVQKRENKKKKKKTTSRWTTIYLSKIALSRSDCLSIERVTGWDSVRDFASVYSVWYKGVENPLPKNSHPPVTGIRVLRGYLREVSIFICMCEFIIHTYMKLCTC